MKLVILESPYSGDTPTNIAYAKQCTLDSLYRGESPLVSHLLYTLPGVLDDTVPRDRQLGIAAGTAWLHVADALVVYIDLDITPGMQTRIDQAELLNVAIEYRYIYTNYSERPQ